MGGEPLAVVSIGLTVLIGVLLYAMMRGIQNEVDLLPVLQERMNEEHKRRTAEESRVIARIDRLDRDWRALFAGLEKYILSIEGRLQRLEHRMDEVQGRHDGEKIDPNRLT